MTLDEIQKEQAVWSARNFPGAEDYYPLLGAVEELGELAHAHLKGIQGIRGSAEDHAKAARDAVGDVVIYLLDYCSRRGWSMSEILDATWRHVRQRDWRSDSARGE